MIDTSKVTLVKKTTHGVYAAKRHSEIVKAQIVYCTTPPPCAEQGSTDMHVPKQKSMYTCDVSVFQSAQYAHTRYTHIRQSNGVL